MNFKIAIIALLATIGQALAIIFFLGGVCILLQYKSITDTMVFLIIVTITIIFICSIVGNYRKLLLEEMWRVYGGRIKKVTIKTEKTIHTNKET